MRNFKYWTCSEKQFTLLFLKHISSQFIVCFLHTHTILTLQQRQTQPLLKITSSWCLVDWNFKLSIFSPAKRGKNQPADNEKWKITPWFSFPWTKKKSFNTFHQAAENWLSPLLATRNSHLIPPFFRHVVDPTTTSHPRRRQGKGLRPDDRPASRECFLSTARGGGWFMVSRSRHPVLSCELA